MQTGKMDRRVTFKTRSTARDAYNEQVNTWIDQFTVWAAVKPISDGERFGNSEVKAYATHRFTIRHSSDTAQIKPTWRLVHEGAEYDISGIKELDGRLKLLEITATKRAE